MNEASMLYPALVMAASLPPLAGQAHHAYAEYDQEQTVEIEGTLVKAAFQNPHLSLKVQVAGTTPSTWEIEGSGINALQRAGSGRLMSEGERRLRPTAVVPASVPLVVSRPT